MKISIVVATDLNGAIGKDGSLLWHLPADMKYFKELTWGHHVVMGRKTFESIPTKFRPLPGRPNIIVSRNSGYVAEGCKVVGSVGAAVDFAKDMGERELMVIGGGEIYKQALDLADRVYLTSVTHFFPEADTFFRLPVADWRLTRSEHYAADEKNKFDMTFQVFDRP